MRKQDRGIEKPTSITSKGLVSKKRSVAVPLQSYSALERPEKNVFELPKHSASLADEEFRALKAVESERLMPQI